MITSSRSGMVFLFERSDNSEFKKAKLLRVADGKVLNAGTDASCHVVDWDLDGDNDLIVSGRSSLTPRADDVQFVENTGSAKDLILASPKRLKSDGKPITPPFGISPFVADWNNDGRHGLLIGRRDGSVILYHNIGHRNSPRLGPVQVLGESDRKQAQARIKAGIPCRGHGSEICVTDWNNDGILDLLMGDQQSETVHSQVADVEGRLAEDRQEAVRILNDYRSLRKRVANATGAKKNFIQKTRDRLAQRLTEVRSRIFELEKSMEPKQKSHGYVWLLLRSRS